MINLKENRLTLVVIDGPSASGKDTLIGSLADAINQRQHYFHAFSEEEEDLHRDEIIQAREKGRQVGGTGDKEMASTIIDHRVKIYQRNIVPCKIYGQIYPKIIMANRGLPATLAYQSLRGEISMEAIWDEHQKQQVPNPDLVVITNCLPVTAQSREGARQTNEKGLSGSVTKETGATAEATFRRRQDLHRNFRRVAEFLRDKSLPVIELDTDFLTLEEETKIVLRHIFKL